MIDIQLLRVMRNRLDFYKVKNAVDLRTLEPKTRAIINAMGKYFKQFPSHGTIDFSLFIPFMFRSVYPDLGHEDQEIYTNIVKSIVKSYPDEETRLGILQSVHEYNAIHALSQIVSKYNEGEEIDPMLATRAVLERYNKAAGQQELPEVDENIDHLLDVSGTCGGLLWRLDSINSAMRPFRGGDFVIVAARPDQGKTSFLCSELTFMAPQLPPDRPVVWLNNEGLGDRIRVRAMQAALNMNYKELVAAKDAGTLYDQYHEAIGGKNKIRVMDIHGYNVAQVEQIIQETNPGVICFDMVDNVYGFGDAARTDLQLEKLYQWTRERAVKYDTAIIATSQISNEGANEQFPPMSALKDSKTGKQGACDSILMIGSIENDPTLVNTRFLSLPKNKLRPPNASQLRERVIFDRDRSRYRDIKQEATNE